LQPFQLYAIAADLREFVLSLLHQPAVFAASENLGQPHGHFGRYAALPVYQFRKRVPRNAKGLGGFRNRQAQRLDAPAQHNASGVEWIFSWSWTGSHSMVVNILRESNEAFPRQNFDVRKAKYVS
jgi:hypothetical protein